MKNLDYQNRFRLILGFLLISLGIVLLLDQILAIRVIDVLWPFFIIIPGVAFFMAMATGGSERGGLAIPASILTMLGGLLLYQSITGHWESWAYAWSLIFPISVGVGIALQGARTASPALQKTGMGFIRVGLVIFLSAGVFFEMFLGISHSVTHRVAWSIVIVLAGTTLLLRQAGWLRLPDRIASLFPAIMSEEMPSVDSQEGTAKESDEQLEPSEEV